MIDMTIYTAPDGSQIELDEAAVADFLALAHLTRQNPAEVFAGAIEHARNLLIPSTKPVVVKAARKTKGAS